MLIVSCPSFVGMKLLPWAIGYSVENEPRAEGN